MFFILPPRLLVQYVMDFDFQQFFTKLWMQELTDVAKSL